MIAPILVYIYDRKKKAGPKTAASVELRLTLEREGFTATRLNTAVSQMTNEEMTADIISLIRRYAIGSPLQSHETRVKNAIQKLKRAHRFSRQELNWIDRIGTYLLNEYVIITKVFDEDVRFRSQGGYARINKAFRRGSNA